MSKLNLILQFRAFFRRQDDTLNHSAIALYNALLHVANESSYEGGINQTFTVDNERLMKLAGIGSKNTLNLQRKALCERGLIKYVCGGRFEKGRRTVGKYELIKLYKN